MDGSNHPPKLSTANQGLDKITKEALLKAGALQNAILNSANFSSIATDAKGVIQLFNVGAERMLGYTAADVINKLTPADISDSQEIIARAKALSVELGTLIAPGFEALVFKSSNGIEDIYELTYIRKDGSRFPAVVSVTALRDEQNAIIGYLLIGTDNTTRKQAEDALRLIGKRAKEKIHQLNAKLERRIIQRTAQLQAANTDLESFSYSVSHDLRAPLRAIDGFATILRENYVAKLDDEGKRLLQVVSDNARKMAQLIDDILAFSRAGRSELRLITLDMNALVQQVWQELEPRRAGRAIELRLVSLPTASGDPAAVRQVLENLLDNAVKFTRGREALIEVEGHREGDENIYFIRDNGAGFDMAYVNKLFGLFQRLHGMEEFEGTGVGLAIVKRFITKLGGRVWAAGKTGEGATFWFSLPADVQQTEMIHEL